jgi:hypothetical protein
MSSLIRAIVRAAIVAAAALLPTVPSHAENIAYVAPSGGGLACSSFSPCLTVAAALTVISPPLRVKCINGAGNGTGTIGGGFTYSASGVVLDIDCPQATIPQLGFSGASNTVRVLHFGFRNIGLGSQFIFQGSGTVFLDDCVFEDAGGPALDIEPNGPLTLVIKNSRVLNSASGLLLKPAAGGSINATFEHVTITGSSGGGIKADTTNGPVTLDISDSEISGNAGNGINAIGNAGGQAIVSIKNSVMARNGAAGVQANGANAGVLIATTLFDQNAAGATSIVSGGNIFTYANNQIVGTAGSGFNHTAGLQ